MTRDHDHSGGPVSDFSLKDLDVKFKGRYPAYPDEEYYLATEVDAFMKKLKDAIEKAPRVYGLTDSDAIWQLSKPDPSDTHSALLLCIESLKPKSVEVTREQLRKALEGTCNKPQVGFFEGVCQELGL